MSNMHNFIVVWQPMGDGTVDTCKVIDAWASTSRSLAGASREMVGNADKYRAEHGEGIVTVHLAGDSFRHIL